MDSVSIILCVRNGMEFLPKLFASLRRQRKVGRVEFIITDTESTDGSVEFIKRSHLVQGATLIKIKTRDFGHGKIRNWLVKKVKTDVVVFLSQDSLPKGNLWLFNLLKPLDNRQIVASYSRQIPYPKTNFCESFFYRRAYPAKNKIQAGKIKFSVDTVFYSMVSSAVRRKYLLQYPFVENKDASVDHWWAKEVLYYGGKIAYQADSIVYHSHNYSYRELFRRNFYNGQSLIGFPKSNLFSALFSLFGYLWEEVKFIWKFGDFWEIGGMVIYETVRLAGFVLGSLAF